MFQRDFMRHGAAAVLALAGGLAGGLASGPAFASGSDGGGSAETGKAVAYNMGKGVYASKLACSTCPLAGKSLDAAMARDLLANKGAVTLTPEESQALDAYLKRRFRL